MTTLLQKTVDDPKDTAHFMDQGGTEGIRDVPGRGQVDLPGGLEIELVKDRLKRLKEMLR